jgi:hypothetical protein
MPMAMFENMILRRKALAPVIHKEKNVDTIRSSLIAETYVRIKMSELAPKVTYSNSGEIVEKRSSTITQNNVPHKSDLIIINTYSNFINLFLMIQRKNADTANEDKIK